MSQKKWPLPIPRQKDVSNDHGPLAQRSQGKTVNEGDVKNVAIAPDGSIFIKTLVQIDRKFIYSSNSNRSNN